MTQLNLISAKRQLVVQLSNAFMPRNIGWVFAEDLAWCHGVLFAYARRMGTNERIIDDYLESEPARVFGAELRVIGRTNAMTLCGVVIPRNERDAQQQMISGIKLSVPHIALEAVEVSDTEQWRSTRARHREPAPFDGIE